MTPTKHRVAWHSRWAALALVAASAAGCASTTRPQAAPARHLSHDQTLQWIHEHHAWRLAKKTKPIWARPIDPEELGKEFQTADRAAESAREGYWLCVGVAGEPWFQTPAKVEAKYDLEGDEVKTFAFDPRPRTYHIYRPKQTVRNWVAQVQGPGIAGFSIKPNFAMDRPLSSPAGGYVVKDDVPDPYQDSSDGVWLVQEGLFKSTYDLAP